MSSILDVNGWIDERGRVGGDGSRAYTEKSSEGFGAHSGLESALPSAISLLYG
jgi:hypothetical protein